MGLLTDKDARVFRDFFKEASYLRGMKVYYQYVKSCDTSIHAEFKTELSEYIEMNAIFIENPKVSTLKRIGWVSENPDDKPYIIQLPIDTPNLSTESVVTIPPFSEFTRAREFKITLITTLLEYPDCFTCTLAPIFDNKKEKTDYSNTNYNYVNTEDQPDNDSPDNRNDSGYNYLKIRDNKNV